MHGVYFVNGPRRHRGHDPGSTFVAPLDRAGVTLAERRGHIRLIGFKEVGLERGSFTFPRGWLAAPSPANEDRESGLSHSRR